MRSSGDGLGWDGWSNRSEKKAGYQEQSQWSWSGYEKPRNARLMGVDTPGTLSINPGNGDVEVRRSSADGERDITLA